MFSEMVARTSSLELKVSSWQDSPLLVEKVKAPFSRCSPLDCQYQMTKNHLESTLNTRFPWRFNRVATGPS